VVLPPLQPMLEAATETIPKAKTSATRTRFIVISPKLWPQIEQQRGSSRGQADPDPDLLFCRVTNRAASRWGTFRNPFLGCGLGSPRRAGAASRPHPLPT
jgi:hypothetical protein